MRLGVFVALVHETLKLRAYDCYTDLAEDVKRRCARLKIRYTGRDIHAAIAQVEQSRRQRVTTELRPVRTANASRPGAPPVSRTEASRLLTLACHGAVPIRSMPSVDVVDNYLRDAAHANEFRARARAL